MCGSSVESGCGCSSDYSRYRSSCGAPSSCGGGSGCGAWEVGGSCGGSRGGC